MDTSSPSLFPPPNVWTRLVTNENGAIIPALRVQLSVLWVGEWTDVCTQLYHSTLRMMEAVQMQGYVYSKRKLRWGASWCYPSKHPARGK